MADYCRAYGEAEVSKALEITINHVHRTGEQVQIGYVLGVLKNGKAMGGLVGLSKKPKSDHERKMENIRAYFDKDDEGEEAGKNGPATRSGSDTHSRIGPAKIQADRSIQEAKRTRRMPSTPGPTRTMVADLAGTLAGRTPVVMVKPQAPPRTTKPPPAPPPPDFHRDYISLRSPAIQIAFEGLPENEKQAYARQFEEGKGKLPGKAAVALMNHLRPRMSGGQGASGHA